MSTALTLPQKVAAVRDLLAKSKDQIAAALPRHVTPERMLRVCMTAVQKTPQLLDCDPRSLIGCIVQASQLGLEPDGVLGHAYLIPFRNSKTGGTDCQLIPGYKGLIDLSRRSGQISTIYAKIVHAKDHYKIAYGLKPVLEHRPADDEDPGPVIASYAVAQLRDGGIQYEWMWKREVDTIRKRSRAGGSGPWVTDYEEMCKKTVLRRLCKMLPVSVEVQRLVAADEQFDAGVHESSVDFANILPPPPKPSGLDALADRLTGGTGEADISTEPESEVPGEAEAPPDAGPTEAESIEQQYLGLITEAVNLTAILQIETDAAGNAALDEPAIKRLVDACGQRRSAITNKRGARSNSKPLPGM